ncbi:MAG: glycosyltransferase family 2 protein [Gemmatimonadetes bacterium]|nr:glycosyltransferase family 2 protein [Gemmatimonadota bacterium]
MIIAFWVLIGVVAWCYGGYPLFMIAKARLRSRPPAAAAWTPAVSVVLAVRNEAERIEARIRNVFDQDYPRDRIRILVVCNGCTDDTEAVARGLAEADEAISVLVSPPEGGKAEALNRGVEAARGEVIVFGDARQRFDAQALRRLTAGLADPTVGAVSGRLVIAAAEDVAVGGVHTYWELETALRHAESQTGSVVGVTGAIYAIRRSSYESVPPGTILDDLLIPMRVVLSGLRVCLIEDAVAYDVASPTSGAEFRRKVRTTVGNLQILAAEPRILSPIANPIFGRYVSHKLLRLVTPLCLLGTLVTGYFADGWLYDAFVGVQLGFYVLGAIGLLLPVRLLGIPAAFLLAQGAVLRALFQPARGAESLWGSVRSGRDRPVDGMSCANGANES